MEAQMGMYRVLDKGVYGMVISFIVWGMKLI
jgi:hypothetical protein